MSDFELISHRDELEMILKMSLLRGLEECGLAAEAFAKAELTAKGAVDTGALRNSITHTVESGEVDHTMIVGTNMEYARYVEEGTGIYHAGGRKTPWAYEDDAGVWHRTSGMPARPYIKPSIAKHPDSYIKILKSALTD